MTPEQLQWDKHQWAEYLDCSVQLYKRARNITDCYYSVLIARDQIDKYRVVLIKKTYEKNRFGQTQLFKVIQKISQETFDKYSDAVQYANEKFIPSLTFKPDIANSLGLPAKILQTLHVNTR